MTITFVLLVIFALLAWFRPKHALGILLATLPSYLIRFQLSGIPTTFLELMIVVFLFATLLKLKPKNLKELASLGNINLAIGMFVLAGIISVFASPETNRALGQLKAFIVEPVLLFYAILLTVKNEAEVKVLLRWLFSGAGAVSLFGIIQYFTFLHLPPRFWGGGEEPARIVSFFEHPNQLALYLAPLLIFYIALLVNNYPIFQTKKLSYLTLTGMVWALLLTFSRGAWLGAGVSLLLILWQKYPPKKLLVPVLIGASLLLLFPAVRHRLGVGLSDASSDAHWDLMRAGINKIIDSPLTGNGLYGFRTTLQESNFSGEVINYPHNIILNFWVEMGLLGVLSFAWIYFLAWQAYKKYPSQLKFAAGMFLVAVFIHGLVDIPYLKNDLSVVFWFVVSLFYVRSSQ